jgi:hypothetical protein
MPYKVIWLSLVIRRVAQLYLDLRSVGGDTEAMTRAMAAVDRELERAPLAVGESRNDPARVIIERPLTVYYEVYPDERVVVVTSVRMPTYGGKPPKRIDP